MATPSNRRDFLTSSATSTVGVLAGISGTSFVGRLPSVSAQEAKLAPEIVKLAPDIEPVVRLLEETPREDLLESIAQRIRGGLSYREVLAALLLAGVRNVQPRPSVGFKFHAVLVVNSAHLASMASPDQHRWLPIFWALDYFKSSQARDVREGNWTMASVDESAVPSAEKSPTAFSQAMDGWDEAAADAAVAGLARTASSGEVYEMLYRFGARDYRSIGHKAIFTANSYRTLGCIGWRYAEPVLRSLAYAMLNHEEGNPAKRDAEPDRPWRRNVEAVKKIRHDWRSGKLDDGAVTELLSVLRNDSWRQSCDAVIGMLNKGVAPQSIWDALFVGAGELLVRQPGIVALHALTTSNALRFAFDATASDETRRLLLLQNAAFLPMFRESMGGRGKVADFRLDELQADPTKTKGDALREEILTDISGNRRQAAQKVLTYLKQGESSQRLIDAARVLVFLKGRDSHDYKFSSAVLEDYYHISPAWRDRYLAASVYKLHGSGERENSLVKRTRAAFQG